MTHPDDNRGRELRIDPCCLPCLVKPAAALGLGDAPLVVQDYFLARCPQCKTADDCVHLLFLLTDVRACECRHCGLTWYRMTTKEQESDGS